MESQRRDRADRPPGSLKLFVGMIPRQATEEQLKPIFEEYGGVWEVILLRDRNTNQSKGCAFVTYNSKAEADAAIGRLHNIKIIPPMDRALQVKYADGELERLEHKIFVGMIPKTASEAELMPLFNQFGLVQECVILRDNSGTSKGCGFIKLENREQAQRAITALNGIFRMEGSPAPLSVKFAESEKEKLEKKQRQAQAMIQPFLLNSYMNNVPGGGMGMGMGMGANAMNTPGGIEGQNESIISTVLEITRQHRFCVSWCGVACVFVYFCVVLCWNVACVCLMFVYPRRQCVRLSPPQQLHRH
mmetsp:Transcript_17550/g.28830  ORF Transcript_17550/g.28830 Transcript_17550/m.28830 type:complete len:303 (+) Transcript_17550:65-973(+)